MLVKLSARDLRPLGEVSSARFIGRISEDDGLPAADRGRHILLVRGRPEALPAGFRGYLFYEEPASRMERDAYVLGPSLRYLSEGDIVRIEPARRRCSVLYRRSSRSNTFLVTERCDNYCLMCSQPPKDHDDSWLADELIDKVIPLIAPDTAELGITGGEPALLGHRLVDIVAAMKRSLPDTAVHVLSNGRRFAHPEFAQSLGRVEHPDLMVGIPVYSALSEEHDHVVQARGAFDDTIRGILNLKRAGVRIELRMVIHRYTYAALPEFARFVTRNLIFADHVALMGLEQVGFGKANLDDLWIDPVDYSAQLVEAVGILHRARALVSIYNHQLCVLPKELHEVARRSISDWKNSYLDECNDCRERDSCGGFFVSSMDRRSRGIAAVL